MTRILMTALVVTLLSGCVTSADLMRIEAKVDSVTADGIVTEDEGDELKSEIAAVAKEVEERTGDLLEELAATGGITGLLTAFGVSAYRNATRKKLVAEVASQKPDANG